MCEHVRVCWKYDEITFPVILGQSHGFSSCFFAAAGACLYVSRRAGAISLLRHKHLMYQYALRRNLSSLGRTAQVHLAPNLRPAAPWLLSNRLLPETS
jgi:hypothetical protein